jgi:hypothetical protein
MATIFHAGPHFMDFGPAGLAPAKSVNSVWHSWVPEPKNFSLALAAHPEYYVSGTGTVAANALKISDVSVQYVPRVQGDLIFTKLQVYALFTNTGPAAIRRATLYITFIMP